MDHYRVARDLMTQDQEVVDVGSISFLLDGVEVFRDSEGVDVSYKLIAAIYPDDSCGVIIIDEAFSINATQSDLIEVSLNNMYR